MRQEEIAMVLLVERHRGLRGALASALDQEPDLQVGAQADSLAVVRTVLVLGGINAAIVSLDLPEGEGFECVAELANATPTISVLALTETRDPAVYALAQEAGASEVLTYSASLEVVISTIKRISQ
jgi:two-component system response regulator DesR